MRTLTALARRHPMSAYFALTFAISWGGAVLAMSGGAMHGTTPSSDPRFAYALMAMLAGPSATGILLTWIVAGREGLREYAERLLTWRLGTRWYVIALATGPAAMIVTLLALSLWSPAFLPGLFTSDDTISILVVGLAVGVSAGVLEELGWTGFAIARLRRRCSIVATGLFVGVLWSAWHLLPNIWSARAAMGELPTPVYMASTAVGIFVGYLTAFRVLMVWVYDRTRSTVLGMLMHVSFTASLLILNPVALAGSQLVAYSFALAAVMWIVVAAVVAFERREDLHLLTGRLQHN